MNEPAGWGIEDEHGLKKKLFRKRMDATAYAHTYRNDGVVGKVVPLYRVAETPELRHDDMDGWRWIEDGEPLQEGDEFRTDDESPWVKVWSVYYGYRPPFASISRHYRRRLEKPDPAAKPDCKDGWRRLEVGERIAVGDEACVTSYPSETWAVLDVDSWAVGRTMRDWMVGFYRRRVTECRPTDAETDKTSQAKPACCGERQVPDVGEGWRLLEVGEVAGHTDQWWHHIRQCWMANTFDGINVVSSNSHTYRRRVTPAPAAPQLSPAAVSAMCQRNERDALLKKIATLRSEAEQQQEIIMHAGLEIANLTAEVERLRLTKEECYWLRKVASQVQSAGNANGATKVFDMLKRLGGGE